MTLQARCPTNDTEIALGFPVYPSEQALRPLARGEVRGTRLVSGEIKVEVRECPSCGRKHLFIARDDSAA